MRLCKLEGKRVIKIYSYNFVYQCMNKKYIQVRAKNHVFFVANWCVEPCSSDRNDIRTSLQWRLVRATYGYAPYH